MLHRSIGRRAAPSDQSLDRTDVDDGAVPLFDHKRQGFARDILRPHQRHAQTLGPFLIGSFAGIVPVWANVSGVIAQHIDAAAALRDALYHAGYLNSGGDIAFNESPFAALLANVR